MIEREKCYPGSNVKVTSGLFVLECENGHRGWYLIPTDVCAKCGAEITRETTPDGSQIVRTTDAFLPI